MRFLAVLLALCVLLSSGVATAAERTHVVQAGQRLGSIAKRYNVSIEDLCNANGIRQSQVLKVGLRLVIPEAGKRKGKGASVEARSRESSSSKVPPELDSVESSERAQPPLSSAKAASSRAAAPKAAPAEPKIHVVRAGQRLGSIAKRYSVSIDAICNASGVNRKSVLKPNQRLLIPAEGDPDGEYAKRLREDGSFDLSEDRKSQKTSARSAKGSWHRYARQPLKRGYIKLVGYHQSWKGYAVGPSGKLLPNARKAITSLLNSSPEWPEVDPRLVRLLVQLSDRFGGREIRIVSGLREKSYVQDSRHHLGRAVDFYIVGVPNAALRDYLLTLDRVGVGYYPNSTFVHLDVRAVKAHWVDYSGPGEPPRLAPRSVAHEVLRKAESGVP